MSFASESIMSSEDSSPSEYEFDFNLELDDCSTKPMDDDDSIFTDSIFSEDSDNHRDRKSLLIAFAILCQKSSTYTVDGKTPNLPVGIYDAVVPKIERIKSNRRLFTRMYRLSPECFDKILAIIDPVILP